MNNFQAESMISSARLYQFGTFCLYWKDKDGVDVLVFRF